MLAVKGNVEKPGDVSFYDAVPEESANGIAGGNGNEGALIREPEVEQRAPIEAMLHVFDQEGGLLMSRLGEGGHIVRRPAVDGTGGAIPNCENRGVASRLQRALYHELTIAIAFKTINLV